MSNVRLMPKWLTALVPIAFALAAIAPLGCGGKANPTPEPPEVTQPSQEAGIRSIEVAPVSLVPAFSDGVRSYATSATYTELSNFTLKVELKDPTAQLFINNKLEQDSSWVSVPLEYGSNTIAISTLAEDRKNGDYYSVVVTKRVPNTKIWVLDGMGGTHVEDTVITIRDTNGNLLQGDIALPRDKNGSMILALDNDKKYNIHAIGKKSAQSCFANFDRSREDTVALYCLPGWSAPYSLEAPIITDISFSNSTAASATWKSLTPSDNAVADTRANLAYIRITAISKNPITGLVGTEIQPILINFNNVASRFVTNVFYSWTVLEEARYNPIDGVDYWRTTFRYALYPEDYVNNDNWLSVVAYDVAGNRAERRIFTTFTTGNNFASDPDVKAVVPRLVEVQAQTYGGSEHFPSTFPVDLQAISPVEGHGAYYYTYMRFFPVGTIRGFEIWRSADTEDNFEKIASYTNWSTMSGQWDQQYLERTPGIEENRWFYYKVRGFNGSGYTQFSNVLGIKPMPAFVTDLASPAHNEVSKRLWPNFTFKLTDAMMTDPEVSDIMCFSLFVKPMNGFYPVMDVMFNVFFEDLDEEGAPYVEYYSSDPDIMGNVPAYYEGEDGELIPIVHIEDNGTIRVDTDNDEFQKAAYWSVPEDWFLMPGAAYEWSIFGVYGGYYELIGDSPSNAAWFRKWWDVPQGSPSGASTHGVSYGSVVKYGLGSPNGFYTLILASDAK